MSLRVRGVPELEAALAEISTATEKRIGRKALTEGGKITAEEMAALAPRRSGRLAESITVSPKSNKGRKMKDAEIELYVGPNIRQALHGIFQEFGTYKHPPQPFARPAWEATKSQVLDKIRDVFAEGVRKSAARARARALKLKG